MKWELKLPLRTAPTTRHIVAAICYFLVCSHSEGSVDTRSSMSHEVKNSDLVVIVKGIMREQHAVIITRYELLGRREQIVRGKEVIPYICKIQWFL